MIDGEHVRMMMLEEAAEAAKLNRAACQDLDPLSQSPNKKLFWEYRKLGLIQPRNTIMHYGFFSVSANGNGTGTGTDRLSPY